MTDKVVPFRRPTFIETVIGPPEVPEPREKVFTCQAMILASHCDNQTLWFLHADGTIECIKCGRVHESLRTFDPTERP